MGVGTGSRPDLRLRLRRAEQEAANRKASEQLRADDAAANPVTHATLRHALALMAILHGFAGMRRSGSFWGSYPCCLAKQRPGELPGVIIVMKQQLYINVT